MSRCVFFGLFAVLAYTTAMMHEPEQVGYSKSDRDGMSKLVKRVSSDSGGVNMSDKELEFSDTDWLCLVSWANQSHTAAKRGLHGKL
jgi:gentisate 1,2-dioxygenase